MSASEVFARFDALKKRHQDAKSSLAVAQSQFDQAQGLVAKAEETLRAQGVDPANAEAELTARLAQLDTEIAACDTEVTARMAEYKDIGAAFAKING